VHYVRNSRFEAYLGKFRDAEGRVEQLALLHPDRVAVEAPVPSVA
jgi:hypothetical protein